MDLQATLAAQRTAFMAELPVTPATRKDRLNRAIALISDNADAFCDMLSEDFGHRSRAQSMMTDIAASVASLRHARANVDRWARPERRGVTFPLGLLGARAWIDYRPKGVVGVIAPWNFPVNLVMAPLAGILAAGNRAMVKTSEYTPATAALFERLVPRYFALDELAFVSGGADVGHAFAGLPFDHLLFTGATEIARHILHAAADNLTPVTLELGGKSPVILGRSADIVFAMERVATGKMLNAGQICLAPDYMLVPVEREAEVVDALRASATALYPTLVANVDYTSVVSDRHFDRLTAWIKDAAAKGADIVTINPGREDFSATNNRKMPLTLVRGATDDMIVMQQEIFGPILPICTYGTVEDAIAQVNRRDRPLALYYFGRDADERQHVLDRTLSGGVTLDDVIFHVAQEDLPFGGIGSSGMGAYHGREGFRTFSHARSTYRQSRFDVAGFAGLKPPYGKSTWRTITRQMKH